MKLGLHQSTRLEQRLLQSPQMIQAMQILQLPGLALEERIEQELTENPCLEIRQDGEGEGEAGSEAESEAAPEGEAAEAKASEEDARPEGVDAILDLLERYEGDFGDGRTPRPNGSEEGDRKLEAMANAPTPPQGLAGALLDQVAFLNLSDDDRTLLEYLAWSMDERGYLPTPREELVAELSVELGRPVEPGEVEAALEELRSVSHPAIGARDLREGLLLQLDARGFEGELVRALVRDHLEDIEANRLPRIARATGRSMEEVKEAIEHIRHLDPAPGAGYGDVPSAIIVPDVIVERVDGDYLVRLERQRVPELSISPLYRRILAQAQPREGVTPEELARSKEEREWIRKRLESARWFIDALQQRESTLERIAKAIFAHQREFLDKGPSSLRPLRMQEVADELSIHISTVSRGVSGKYAQTPRGIHPLKYFFTGGTPKASGEVASQVSIKERIRDLIEKEDGREPLSDDQIATLLGEREGIKIARRTVTKYRMALGLPSSSQRRRY